MAELNTGGGGGHGKHDKKRAKKQSTRVDMTPMVDLAFLLLTFFVLTSTFNKPKAMDLAFPAKPKPDEQIKKQKANGITVLLTDKDGVYYYPGALKPETPLTKSDYSKDGLRKTLLMNNGWAVSEMKKLNTEFQKSGMADTIFKKKSIAIKGDEKALVVLVKADDKASYKNVIDVIDELNICSVGKFAIMDMTPEEKAKLLTAK
jgi:biopolymer transport protein ExbD